MKILGYEGLAGALAKFPFTDRLALALKGAGVTEAYLVGGLVRDAAMGRVKPVPDFDVALPRFKAEVAVAAGKALGASPFCLDEGTGAWRLAGEGGLTVDLVPFRGRDILEDLEGRDFTLNAMAYDLLSGKSVLDPLHGMAALNDGILIACRADAFLKDPLRVLRAYRFSAVHGLRFGPGLAGLLRDHADLLNGVSPERVRYELFRLLDGDYASLALRRTVDDGVLEVLFPFLSDWKGFDQGSYHAHDLLEHSLQAVENIERVLADERLEDFAEKLALHFDETLEADITRLSLLKWVGFFHDVAKPETLTIEKSGRRRFIGHDLIGGKKAESLLGSMRVGNRAAHAASRIIAAHMRLFGLAHQEKPTERSRLRYLADLSYEAPEAVILSLADEIATGEREPGERDAFWRTVAELLNLYFNREEKPQPLIRGRDLVATLGMAEGAEVGLILAAVADAETQGLVSTREEALEYAGKLLKRG